MLIDKKMNKKDLRLSAGISTAVIAKLGKGKNVTTDMLLKFAMCLIATLQTLWKLSGSKYTK
ncbi:MAG: helix-turn-helix domain-containing protein [Helicobacteraceae bacterium]|jgi:DNA-binding Xre family transcriptional regulator|nr:helix-turn-helix domain-containing protein [Helicobacteraceae bacterium]